MLAGIEHLVAAGPLVLAIPVAAAAGAVTFLSPCCLPLVPGYLSYLTGMSGAGAAERVPAEPAAMPAGATVAGATVAAGDGTAGGGTSTALITAGPAPAPSIRGRAVLGTMLFVLGFSAVFAVEGIVLGSLGQAMYLHAQILTRVLGVLVILLGLMFAGLLDRFTFAGRIFRPQFRPQAGLAGAPVLGVLFGLSWTPCIGPTLGAVLTLALNSGTAARGALLAFVYALGLGVPFLIVAFAVQRGVSLFGFARRHARLITQVGGLLLILVGLAEVTGAWQSVISWLQVHWLAGLNSPI
ncbi:MAG TPA: cytochrome c biogenesis CcdA family protein [Streptosporangiaceae bacterium]